MSITDVLFFFFILLLNLNYIILGTMDDVERFELEEIEKAKKLLVEGPKVEIEGEESDA
jgi:hypothetical protein